MRHYDIGGCLDHQHSDNREWREAGGGIQSLCFYHVILGRLSDTSFDMGSPTTFVAQGGCPTIHDYGCGMGDGIALVQAALPQSKCYGFDVDEIRILAARERWPTIPFEIEDVATTDRKADVIMSIHTLEHVPNALSIVSRLRSLCSTLVIVYPDLTHGARGGHSEEAPTSAEFSFELSLKGGILHQSHYATARRYSHDEPLMLEGNNLFVLKGER